MARSVGDLALLLSVMSGADPRAPLGRAEPSLPAAILDEPVAGRRIGWLVGYAGALPTEDGILDLCEQALASLRAAGCTVEEADLGMSAAEIWTCWLTWRHVLMAGRFAAPHADPAKRALLKHELVWGIEGGLRLLAVDLYGASQARTRLFSRLLALFKRYDALALPSVQVFPFAQELDWPKSIAGTTMDSYHRWMEVVVPGTLSGCPVVCLPAGLGGPRRLPSGLQLIGRLGGDRELLRLARAYEIEAKPAETIPKIQRRCILR